MNLANLFNSAIYCIIPLLIAIILWGIATFGLKLYLLHLDKKYGKEKKNDKKI